MNQKEIEKEIWRSMVVMAYNFQDFDRQVFENLRNGHIDDDWDYPDAEPLSSKAHQERFDKALNRVVEILSKKVEK